RHMLLHQRPPTVAFLGRGPGILDVRAPTCPTPTNGMCGRPSSPTGNAGAAPPASRSPSASPEPPVGGGSLVGWRGCKLEGRPPRRVGRGLDGARSRPLRVSPLQEGSEMTDDVTTDTRWRLTGDWFDVCKCAIPCPCTFAQPPTYGDCEGVLVWHIREGSFGDVRLDGLNVLMLGSFTGNPWAGTHTDPYAAVFLDERADEQQRAALGAIFGGEAGGWPAQFGEMFHPEMRGMEFAPVHVEIDEDFATWRAEVPGRVTATAEALTGP